MGWMDKAKKLAEQAQEKLDDAQKNFNQSASPQAEQPAQAVRYDEHGRPIQEEGETPAAAAPPPAAAAPPPAEAAPPAPAEAPAPAEEPAAAPPSEGGANTSPDPFKPIQ
jgi:hypothetical protein